MARKITTKEFIEASRLLYGDRYDYSLVKYINCKQKVKIICKEHGVFEQTPDNHLREHHCYKCRNITISNTLAIVNLKTQEQFIKDAKHIHGNKYNYDLVKYIGSFKKVKIVCSIHGIFEQKPSNHLNGQGCPRCKSIFSNGELIIEQYLEENNVSYVKQKRFGDCKDIRQLPFDFYLPEINTCIEYDGKQHYDTKSKYYSADLIRHDKIKNEYCSKNNIRLIRIQQKKFSEIRNILLTKLPR